MQNGIFWKKLVFGIVLMLVFSVFIIVQTNISAVGDYSSYFAGGDGTEDDPYQIANVDQLQNMSLDLEAYYILVNDIDASITLTWNGGYGFIPIGDYSNRFTGSLDGQGYNIMDLFIDECCENYVGLFRDVGSSGLVSNIGLINNNIIGCDYHGWVGGFSGINHGTILNCYVTGDISGNSVIGGICGENIGTISNCYFTGDVSGNSYLGGIAGSNNYGTTSNCFVSGTVTGTKERIGGITGYNKRGMISNSYVTGRVKGTTSQSYSVGGICGSNTGPFSGDDGTILNCYATGRVSGFCNVCGIVGDNDGIVLNCFWDVETCCSYLCGRGTGKTTAEMKDIATFTDTSTIGLDSPWDFVGDPYDDTGSMDIWDISCLVNDGYPSFSWQITNQKPCVPLIYGPINGKPGTYYEYLFKSTDSDGDDIIEFIINWGDGPDEIVVGPFSSGAPTIIVHCWENYEIYDIMAKAKDIHCTESDWSEPLQVSIIYDLKAVVDIKPGSFPNSINPNSMGNVPVAILTTDEFDASNINPDTVEFLDAIPCKKEKLEDVDGDGDIDMLFHFKIRECDFNLLVNEGNEYPYAYLNGETNDWQLFFSKDTVNLIIHPWSRNRVINRPFLNFLEIHPNMFPLFQLLFQWLGLQ